MFCDSEFHHPIYKIKANLPFLFAFGLLVLLFMWFLVINLSNYAFCLSERETNREDIKLRIQKRHGQKRRMLINKKNKLRSNYKLDCNPNIHRCDSDVIIYLIIVLWKVLSVLNVQYYARSRRYQLTFKQGLYQCACQTLELEISHGGCTLDIAM